MGNALNVDQYLNPEECAEYIKAKKSTVYRWSSQGLIPARKHGGKLVFSKEELDEWSASRRKQPKQASLSKFQAARQRVLSRSSLKAEVTPHDPPLSKERR